MVFKLQENSENNFIFDDFEKHYAEYLKHKISKTELARRIGVSRPTLYKLISEYKEP